VLDIERRQQMVAFIEQNAGATVAELRERFGVSDATVRRDLIRLSKQGYIERGHGEAVPRRLRSFQGLPEMPVLERASLQVEEKRCIGQAAAHYVESGDVIIISGGTTTAQMRDHLGNRCELTVVTNALNIVSLLAPYHDIQTVITGGILRHSELSMFGAMTEDALSNLRVDRLFMGGSAIHVDYGLSADNTIEVQIIRTIMASAKEITVLADHTKLGKIAMMRVAPVERVRRLITDSGVPDASVAPLREQGVEVVLVKRRPCYDVELERDLI
jgi:DeoR family transcriptional regulator of aga operon